MNPAADIWAKVLALMQNEMTTTTINTWFDDTTAVELEGDRFVLYSPTPFKRDIIASRYLPAIQNALREGWSGFVETVQSAAVFLVGHWPFIVVGAVCGVIFYKARHPKHKKQK